MKPQTREDLIVILGALILCSIFAIGVNAIGTGLTGVSITVSDKTTALKLGTITTSDYTCDAKICTYEITRAGKVDVRNFSAVGDREKSYKQDVVNYYENLITKVKSAVVVPKVNTREIVLE